MDATTAIKYNGKSKALSKSSKTLKIPKKAIHHGKSFVEDILRNLWQNVRLLFIDSLACVHKLLCFMHNGNL